MSDPAATVARHCPCWIQPGALMLGGLRIVTVDRRVNYWSPNAAPADIYSVPLDDFSAHPDLTDPATWGVLLSLLPEGWELVGYWDEYHCRNEHGEWDSELGEKEYRIDSKYDERTVDLHSFPTKFDALIAALEASYGNDLCEVVIEIKEKMP